MKKFLVAAVAALFFAGISSNAQIIFSTGYVHAFESNTYISGLDGAYFGANYYYSLDGLVEGLALQPGVSLSFLGGRKYDDKDIRIKERDVNIPILASYTFPLAGNIRVVGLTGPNFQFGISAMALDNMGTSYDLYNIKNRPLYTRNRFNFCWSFAAGVEISDRYRIEAGYDLGFSDVIRDRAEGVSGTSGRGLLHIGVGYFFGR